MSIQLSTRVMHIKDESTGSYDTVDVLKGGGVEDVQVNGTSVVNQGVANVPLASNASPGVGKVNTVYGIYIGSDNYFKTSRAYTADTKNGSNAFMAIVPINQHEAAFYGLAKAAGDSTQSASSNPVGTYTDAAKVAIQKMLGLWTPKFYLKTTPLAQDSPNIPNSDCPFDDVTIGVYEELVITAYQTNGTQTIGSNNYGYITIRDVVNNGYINVSELYFNGNNPGTLRLRRFPKCLSCILESGGSVVSTKTFVRADDYIDTIRWISLSFSNGTVKEGTTIEAFIHNFL